MSADRVARADAILAAPLPEHDPERSREIRRRAAEAARILLPHMPDAALFACRNCKSPVGWIAKDDGRCYECTYGERGELLEAQEETAALRARVAELERVLREAGVALDAVPGWLEKWATLDVDARAAIAEGVLGLAAQIDAALAAALGAG